MQTGITEDLQIIAKKYESCPQCSLQYNPDVIAKKLMEEKYVAVIVRFLKKYFKQFYDYKLKKNFFFFTSLLKSQSLF